MSFVPWPIPSNPRPPWPGNLAALRRHHAAVVGGGLTGLSAAYHLAKAGRQVTLLEAGRIGGGATGRSTGMLGPGVGGPITWLQKRLGDDAAWRAFAATEAAVVDLVDLIRREGLDCDLEETGQLYVSTSYAGAQRLRQRAAALIDLGLRVRLLDSREVAREVGTDAYTCGLRFERAALVDPAKLCAALAARLEAMGVRIHEASPVLDLTPGSDGVTLRLPNGELRAERAVLAAGALVGRLGLLKRRVVPLRVHALLTEPLRPERLSSILPGRESVVGTRTFFNYYRLTPDGRLVFGGGRPSADAEDPRVHALLERELRALFPALRDLPVAGRWSGQVGFTRDRFPLVGEVAPNVLAGVGWCGHGLALSAAGGRVLADLDAGRPAPALPWCRDRAPRHPPVPRWALDGFLHVLASFDRLTPFPSLPTPQEVTRAPVPQ